MKKVANNVTTLVTEAAANTGGAAGAALAAAADDLRALARPVAKSAAEFKPILRGGHNLIVDRSKPGWLLLHIATDEEAFEAIHQVPASKAKLKEDPNAKGKRFLAASDGPMWGSMPIDINGQRFFLKVTLEAERDKG